MIINLKRIIPLIILLAISLNIFFAHINIKNYDKYRPTSNGKSENYLIRSDILAGWKDADEFISNLKSEKNFFESLPVFERWFLPSVLIGSYFYAVDENIFEKEGKSDEFLLKKNNYKFGFLFLQILFFYFSLFLFILKIKKKLNKFSTLILLIFLSFEPTLLQWHASFWSESIYLAMTLILLSFLIDIEKKYLRIFFIGILLGLMFIQRSASMALIVPIIIYFFFVFKKNLFPIFFICLGYFLFLFLIGLSNYQKTSIFFILPYHSKLYSNYHYMLHEIKASSENKTIEKAYKEKIEKKKQWIIDNNINEKNLKDIFKIIDYKNSEFVNEVIQNPINSAKYLVYKICQAAVLDPNWVKKHYFLDKTVEKYYIKFNEDLFWRIVYSMIIYAICLVGFISFIKKSLNKNMQSSFNNFLVLNILMILYFYILAGGYGVSRYFVPTIINLSLFFTLGINYFKK